jgi:succinate dehydrogenase / fumarate reductase cytochrome b subunit
MPAATALERPARVARSSVGLKIAVAASGTIFILFVIAHFLGNLKVFAGEDSFNHYAEGLRTMGAPFFSRGQLLWIARIVLLAALIVHVAVTVKLSLHSRRARPVRYRRFESLAFSRASHTMFWGGLAILAFVTFHLMHLTFGNVHPDFVSGDAYHNFVSGFQSVPVVAVYIVAMIALGLHLYHGVWSAFQTLGANNPRYNSLRRPLALAIAVIVAGGNMMLPLAVLTGLIR